MSARSIGVILGLAVALGATRGYPGEAEESFYKAYYLESEEGRYEAALELYDAVLQASEAPDDLVARARDRRAGCLEELRGRDLARLVPESTLLYLELRRPGKHLVGLVKALGLERVPVGGPSGGEFVLSPSLLEGLGDLVNAAVAVTDVDPRTGQPSGVAVLHLGRNDLLRGFVETSLSGAVVANQLRVGEPVEGYPAYWAPLGSVVLTRSLVVAGSPPELVAETVRRAAGGDAPSLLDHPALEEVRSERESALAFGLVNTKLLFEKAHAVLEEQGGFPREYWLAQAVTDFESIQWIAGAVGSRDAGLAANAWMRLSETNQMLAYHLTRTPPIGTDALKAVPSGVAALAAFGLSGGEAGPDARTESVLQWTGLDVGREVFANIRHVLAFVLPELRQAGDSRRPPIPEAALVITVRNVGLSEALWGRLLSLAALATNSTARAIRTEAVAGQDCEVYALPEGVEIWTATLPDRLVLATGPKAVGAAVAAAQGKGCVLDDPGFAGSVGAFSSTTSKILLAHGGRVFQMARPFIGMPQEEGDQVQAMLDDVSVAAFTDETPVALHLGVVAGLPKVGPLLPGLLGMGGPVSRSARPAPVVSVRSAIPAPDSGVPADSVTTGDGVLPAAAPWDPARRDVLVQRGAIWRYLDEGDLGGTAWRGPDFDDGSWKSGAAPLGYGEEDLGTEVAFGDDPEAKRMTTYFRTTFEVEDPARYGDVRILLRRDDGAAIFLNGREVVRDNLAQNAGPEDGTQDIAGGAVEGHYFPHTIPASALRAGRNTIAVEVHQANPRSSDVIFDLALEALKRVDSPQPPEPKKGPGPVSISQDV